jgi:hypothetical protein
MLLGFSLSNIYVNYLEIVLQIAYQLEIMVHDNSDIALKAETKVFFS